MKKNWMGLYEGFTPISDLQLPTQDFTKLLDASLLLFLGGTKVTEFFGNSVYGHPYMPAAYHSNILMARGQCLNIGKKATIDDIRTYFRSSQMIISIELLDLTFAERDIICRKALRDAGNNIYDAGGFVRKGSTWKPLACLKMVHSSNKNDYCSDNCVDNFSENPLRRKDDTDAMYNELVLPRKIYVSDLPSEDTAPWHLLEHALANNNQNGTRQVSIIHKGTDFKY